MRILRQKNDTNVALKINMDETKFAEIEIEPIKQQARHPLSVAGVGAIINSPTAISHSAAGVSPLRDSPAAEVATLIDSPTAINRSASSEAALRFFSSVSPPEQIKPRKIDPIREKFYEMRKLASSRPFAQNDSALFYRQAKFMEDFTDTYEGNAKFNMYYPYYQHMGYEYLRTYFTWRTKARQGEIEPTSLSYIFLYIYELLSGIGTSGPTDGLDKLLALWNSFSQGNTALEKYLSKWFKDYHIYYELPHSFSDFVNEHSLQGYYSLAFLFDDNMENKLEIWNSISGYNVANSKFYNEGNQELFSNCFSAVIERIRDFCTDRNTRFEDLFIYSVSRRSPWQPFKQALFSSRYKQTDREIKITEFERYYCKNGQWTANLPIYYSSQKDFVGYIIKKTEACLRQAVKYKYKLAVEMKPGSKPFRELQRPAAKRAELDRVIEKAVADFHRDLNRKIVKVDHTNLARIREESLETQEQLIVPEVPPSPYPPSLTPNSLTPTEPTTPSPPPPDIALTLSFADGWKALKQALTDIERKALSIALQANESIKAFADESDIMLEVLAESINEKAADYIGDSILEVDEEMVLYDEYREDIAKIVQ